MSTPRLVMLLEDVRGTRQDQYRQYPRAHDLGHNPMEWAGILADRLGKFAGLASYPGTFTPEIDPYVEDWLAQIIKMRNMRERLVQLAAVALAAAECCEIHRESLEEKGRGEGMAL